MKKILLTSAAMALLAGAASAQSVLERVLAQTDALGQVTGVFANVADNIGTTSETVYVVTSSDDVISAAEYNELLDAVGDARAAQLTIVPVYDAATGAIASYTVTDATGAPVTGLTLASAEALVASRVETARNTEAAKYTAETIAVGGEINGSITNIVSGLDEVQASVMGTVTAVDVPTVNFGNMATTVLGAVNTGEIGLGTNQVVEEALAGTTQAIRSEIQQIGTLSGLTQVALNSALNSMSINGSISNSLSGVNGSVAAISPDVLEIAMSASDSLSLDGVADLLGSMNTTVLGAVNTGTIVSGVNNQVDGTVAGIVGNSATNMFAATE